MKYQLVIFDFDGTLANSFPWFIRMVNRVAERYRFKQIAQHEVETLRSYSARQLIEYLGIPLWKIPMIALHIRRMLAQDRDEVTTFEGVDDVLAQLSQAGITLALVTSNSYDNVRHVLGEENLALVTYLECSVSLFGKRSRYRKILKQSGVHPSQVLSIGDEIRDMEASAQEQIPFGAVAWGFTHIDALQAHTPAEVFMRMDEVVEKII